MLKKQIQKTAFYLIIALGILGKANAQNNFPVEPPLPINVDTAKNLDIDSGKIWKGLYINPTASYGKALPYGAPIQLTSGATFELGGDVCYFFHPNLGVAIGAQFQQYSFKYSYSSVVASSTFNGLTPNESSAQDTTVVGGYGSSVTYMLDYIRVPVMLRFMSSHIDKIGLYGEAGIITDVLLTSSVSGTATQTEYTFAQASSVPAYNYVSTSTNPVSISETNPDAAKINFDLHFGLGVTIPFTKRMALVLEGSIDFRFLNGGTGANDVATFGSNQYYFYGTGNYGSFNSQSLIAKLLFKL